VLLLGCLHQSLSQAAATTYPTVAKFLEESKSTTFAAILKQLGLADQLEEAAFTVFVPTDKAFASFLTALNVSSVDMLFETFPVFDVIKYHISPQALTTDALPHGQRIQTFLKSYHTNDKLRLAVDLKVLPKKIVIRGWESWAQVTTPNVQAGKSVMHVVDNVLLPQLVRDKGFYPYNLLDMMVYHKTSYFQSAVGTIGADFWDQLKFLEDPVTILLPTDQAFEAATAKLGKLDDLQKDGKLKDLIYYHIAAGFGPSSRMVQNGLIKTWTPGSSWTFVYGTNGDITVKGEKNSAKIIIKDSFTALGAVVHVIDTVLLPKSV